MRIVVNLKILIKFYAIVKLYDVQNLTCNICWLSKKNIHVHEYLEKEKNELELCYVYWFVHN